MKTLIVF